jgi:hypothetical protein
MYRRDEVEQAEAFARMEKTYEQRRTGQRETCAGGGRYGPPYILKGLKYWMIACGASQLVVSIHRAATFVAVEAGALPVIGMISGGMMSDGTDGPFEFTGHMVSSRLGETLWHALCMGILAAAVCGTISIVVGRRIGRGRRLGLWDEGNCDSVTRQLGWVSFFSLVCGCGVWAFVAWMALFSETSGIDWTLPLANVGILCGLAVQWAVFLGRDANVFATDAHIL